MVFWKLQNKKIKGEFQNKIYIKVINYFFIKNKSFEGDLGNIYFNLVYFYSKYIFLIVKTCKIGSENDFNTPFQIYFYEYINFNKFNGQNQLNEILNDFLRAQETPLNSNADINNQEIYFNQSNFNEYLAINNQFYIYYNKFPLINNNDQKCFLKCFIFILHSLLILFVIIIIKEDVNNFFINGGLFAIFFFFVYFFFVLYAFN